MYWFFRICFGFFRLLEFVTLYVYKYEKACTETRKLSIKMRILPINLREPTIAVPRKADPKRFRNMAVTNRPYDTYLPKWILSKETDRQYSGTETSIPVFLLHPIPVINHHFLREQVHFYRLLTRVILLIALVRIVG